MPHRHDAGYISDYPDMVEPAFILFDGKGGGEFVFGCVTGAIRRSQLHLHRATVEDFFNSLLKHFPLKTKRNQRGRDSWRIRLG